MKVYKLYFVVSTLILLPVFAYGGVASVACNGCSESQKIRAAEAQAFKHDYVVILDFKSKLANKYRTLQSIGPRGEPDIEVYEVPLSGAEQKDIQLMYDYRAELINVIKNAESKSSQSFFGGARLAQRSASQSEQFVYVGNIAVKGSPYDFMTISSMRNDIYDYYFDRNTSVLTEIISNTLNTIDFPSMGDMDVYLEIDFFVDSEMQEPNGFVSVTFEIATKSFEVLGGRDGFNNTIPLKPSKVNGGYSFNGAGEGTEKTKFETYIGTFFNSGGGCSVTHTQETHGKVIYYYTC